MTDNLPPAPGTDGVDNDENGVEPFDRVEPVDLNTTMQRSYIEYAMSVIVSRALPDVRDGFKPVHRRIIYAMYNGGYRPDRGFNKCQRVVGEVMGQYHPHGDSAIYDALVRLVQPWVMRYPLVQGQGNFGNAGHDGAAAARYTECRMDPLAMEMVRDIREDTVDFSPNYDGKIEEPDILPARIPNLLINGSSGIAVGMATMIPPHNLREVADAAQWLLANPEATKEERLEACIRYIKGPDFPTAAQIVGRSGIEDAYRTGRGSITMRAKVEVEEIEGRTCLVATELPYMTNPDTLATKIAELAKDGRLQGIADIRDESSGRTGQRLVIVLKRDAVAKVVLNHLYKQTALQSNFSANMLALVDGVPRTLPISAFVRYWVEHQIDVILRRTKYRLNVALARMHILVALLKALDMLDEVIALIRRSPTPEEAREGLMGLLDIDEDQANAILDMQLRRLAALERQKLIDEHEELAARIEDYKDIIAKPQRQRAIVSEELDEVVEKWGDDRRTQIVPYEGEMSMEDFIAEENVVVSITRGGYAKRTRVDEYRSQRRGGKGVRGASLRDDDIVEHFFVTSTHDWILFFTNLGRVYRAKAYELPEGARDAKGQHVANLLEFQPDENIAAVLAIPNYEVAPYLVIATRKGLVKKTRLEEYDSPRSGGLIAVNLREGDELIGVTGLNDDDGLLLVSRKGQSLRIRGDNDTMRPMGRATSGVVGMKFRKGDELLAMCLIPSWLDPDVFVVFENGIAKRTPASDYPVKGRAGLGVKVASMNDRAGDLVGALTVDENDEVMVVMEKGKVVRSRVDEVRRTGRNTMGVQFAKPDKGDAIVGVARNPESDVDDDEDNGNGNGDNGSGGDNDAGNGDNGDAGAVHEAGAANEQALTESGDQAGSHTVGDEQGNNGPADEHENNISGGTTGDVDDDGGRQ